MNSNARLKYIIGAAVAVVLLVFVIVWRVSKSHARDAAADLVSASADMVRCVGGESVTVERAAVNHALRRRMVTVLPDISPVSDCPQAMETVQEKLAAHQQAWFGSQGSSGKDGQPIGARIRKAVDTLNGLDYAKPANKLLRKKDETAPMFQLPGVAMDLYEACAELYDKEGASADDVAKARDNKLRHARKVPDPAPAARAITSVPGRVKPENWQLVPASPEKVLLTALSDQGAVLLAISNDGGKTWQPASGKLPAGTEQQIVGTWAPGHETWVIGSWVTPDKKVKVGTAKAAGGKVAEMSPLPDPPAEWARPADAPREAVMLAGGVAAYPVWRVADKPKARKKDEEKQRKEWQKHLDDKEVQLQLVLDEARRRVHLALGIDDDHIRLDGIAYVQPGGAVTVKPLDGYGLGALIPGPEPMVLLGKDELPTYIALGAKVPGPDESLGSMATATATKPFNPWYRSTPWMRCQASDGTHYGFTDGGLQLVAMRPGSIELTMMTATAENGHTGCGENTMVFGYPFEQDRIFATAITVKNNELEGGKVATTSGTQLDEYNSTVATGLVQGAVVVAWVAEGYVSAVVSRNWGTEYGAPDLMAEARVDGSKISGVRVNGLGSRLVMVFAREQCTGQNSCTTTFEMLQSEDQAKTWVGN